MVLTHFPSFHHYTLLIYLCKMAGNAWKMFNVIVNNGERRGWGMEGLSLGPGGRCVPVTQTPTQLFPHLLHF